MKKPSYFHMSLIAVAILTGCNSVPQNAALTAAHNSYDSASADRQVTHLAAIELKLAGDSLSIADNALDKGDSVVTVDRLANLANQQIGIARETAKRKAAESAVTKASSEREQALLIASTKETVAANNRVANMQKTADLQTAALIDASDNAAADKSLIIAISAEADSAVQEAKLIGKIADQQAIELQNADAKAASNQALIAQQKLQLNELHAKNTDRGMVITLGDVLFNINKAELKPDGMHNLQKLAGFLKQYPTYKVLVEGYTDSTGSESANQTLSDQRAQAVRAALIAQGINGMRISTRGYGEAFPVASNDTAANRQMNRRVEMIFLDGNGNIPPRLISIK